MASLQLPAKHPQLPAILIGLNRTLIWCMVSPRYPHFLTCWVRISVLKTRN